MKRKLIYLIFAICLVFIMQERVLAQTCEYEYLYIVDDYGEADPSATAYKNDTVTFSNGKISSSSSNKNASDSSLENWSDNSCPGYIVETSEVTGFLFWMKTEYKYYGYSSSVSWDNAETEEMRKNGAPTKKVFQNKGLEEEQPKITCEYDNGLNLLIDATTRSVGGSSNKDTLLAYYHYSVSGTLNDEWFASDGSLGKCLPVTVCFDKVTSVDTVSHYWYTVYIDDLQVPSSKYSSSDCKKTSYSGDKPEYKVDEKHYACTTYGNKLSKINDLYQKLSTASGDEKGPIASEANREINTLKSLCNAAFSTFTYESDCVKACTHLESDVAEIKDNHGINGSGSNNGNCTLSTRLVSWILKLINWLRYIVPVLLILLSVLDFIKAVAADSEDEIKKVTSRFVKRLIVAVIIFILPLCLEFLLGIFGINANNFCL